MFTCSLLTSSLRLASLSLERTDWRPITFSFVQIKTCFQQHGCSIETVTIQRLECTSTVISFLWPLAFLIFVYTVFTLGLLYPEHLPLAFDCVVIACSLKCIRKGLVQGCKASNGVGSACLITSSESGLPHWTWSVRLKATPAKTRTHHLPIGPIVKLQSLLTDVVISPHTDMGGGGQLPTLVITACQHPWA